MTSKNLTTTNFKVRSAKQFIASVDDDETNLYLAVGQNELFAGAAIPQPSDDVFDTTIDTYRTMLYGKKISNNDVNIMIPRYDYTYGTVYAQYNDADPLLFEKQYYAIVNASSYYHVFKVLDNADNSPSTVQPNFADIGPSDNFYQTSDGYIWKYMYTVDSVKVAKFGTQTWFPYQANNTVIDNAISGSINIIEVLSNGLGYNNYTNGTFSTSDVSLNGNNLIYKISPNASNLTDYYKGCLIYITSDPLGNSAGQYRKIIGYNVNSSAKYITLDTPFTNIPVNGSTYQINPSVEVIGDGFQTINVSAWALINSTGNSISSIQILNQGKGYVHATAVVNAHSSVNVVSSANVRPIYSPPGGHGSHPEFELGATGIGLSVTFSNNENGNIFANTSYQRAILINNPKFNDVYLYTSNQEGNFLLSEKVNIFHSELSLSSNSSNVEYVIIVNDSFTTSSNLFPANINSMVVTNVSSGTITNVNTSYIVVDDITCLVRVGDIITGEDSKAFAYISDIKRSGGSKNFSTFVQARKYEGYVFSGTFTNSEIIYQTSTNSYGTLASVNSSALYIVDQHNDISDADSIVGNTSGANFIILNKYKPEANIHSGEVVYVGNFDMVNKDRTRSETFKIIINNSRN